MLSNGALSYNAFIASSTSICGAVVFGPSFTFKILPSLFNLNINSTLPSPLLCNLGVYLPMAKDRILDLILFLYLLIASSSPLENSSLLISLVFVITGLIALLTVLMNLSGIEFKFELILFDIFCKFLFIMIESLF